jgi:hypothetical protein
MLTAIPLISMIVAALSAVFSWWNYRLSNKLATRSLFLEGQKFVLEIDRQLLSDPHLWGLYDDGDRALPDPKFDPDAPLFQAKLRAFAYLHLNMFEVILTEASEPGLRGRGMAKVWLTYFHDTLSRSRLVRRVLDEYPQLWNPKLLKLYRKWERRQPKPASGSSA